MAAETVAMKSKKGIISILLSIGLSPIYLRNGKRLNPLISFLLLCGSLCKSAVTEMADDSLHSNRLGTVRTPLFTIFEEDRHRECDYKDQCAVDPPDEETTAFGFCDTSRN